MRSISLGSKNINAYSSLDNQTCYATDVDGYKPILAIPSDSGNSNIVITHISVDPETRKITFTLRNTYSSNVTCTPYGYVLYRRII